MKKIISSLLCFSSLLGFSAYANNSTTNMLLVMNSFNSGYNLGRSLNSYQVSYNHFKAKINIQKYKDTPTCRALWDDSGYFTKDDLELEVRITTDSKYLGEEEKSDKFSTSPLKIKPDRNGNLNHTIHLELQSVLEPGNVYVTIADTDRVLGMDLTDFVDDKLQEIIFSYEDMTTEFDGTCFSGNIVIGDNFHVESLQEQNQKHSFKPRIGDIVLFNCGDQATPGRVTKELKYDQDRARLMFYAEETFPGREFCFDGPIYADNLISKRPEVEVESLNGFRVGDIIENKNLEHYYSSGTVINLYQSGFAHIQPQKDNINSELPYADRLQNIEHFQFSEIDRFLLDTFKPGDTVLTGFLEHKEKGYPDFKRIIKSIDYNYRVRQVEIEFEEIDAKNYFTSGINSRSLEPGYSSQKYIEPAN